MLIVLLLLMATLIIAGCSNTDPATLSQSTSPTGTPSDSPSSTPETSVNPGILTPDSEPNNEPAPSTIPTQNNDSGTPEPAPSPALEVSPTFIPTTTPSSKPAETPNSVHVKKTIAANVSAPAIIRIPALEIVAEIEAVGLTEDNAMDVPKDWRNVGWYELGYTPGQFGSMVMTGHVDSPRSDAGIFRNLHQLEIGDRIYLEAEDGTRYGYIVESYHYYPYDDAPIEKIFGYADVPRLNLITCRGGWNKDADTYDSRLVVYARQTHSIEVGTIEPEGSTNTPPEEN